MGRIRDSSNDGTSNRPRFRLFPSWAFSTCFSILSHQPMDRFTSYSSKEEKTPRSKGILLCLQTEVNNVLACARLWRGKRILSRLLSSFLEKHRSLQCYVQCSDIDDLTSPWTRGGSRYHSRGENVSVIWWEVMRKTFQFYLIAIVKEKLSPIFCAFLHENLKKLYHASLLSHGLFTLFNDSITTLRLTPTHSSQLTTKEPVVSTWNNAIYGAMKHVPHACLFGYV